MFIESYRVWLDFLNVAFFAFVFLFVTLSLILSALHRFQITDFVKAYVSFGAFAFFAKLSVFLHSFLGETAIIGGVLFMLVFMLVCWFLLKVRDRIFFFLPACFAVLIVIEAVNPNFAVLAAEFLVMGFVFVKTFSHFFYPGLPFKICIFYGLFVVISGVVISNLYRSHQKELYYKTMIELKKVSSGFSFRIDYFQSILKSALFIPDLKRLVPHPNPEGNRFLSRLAYIYRADAVFFVSRNGTITLSSLPELLGVNISFRPYFQHSIRGEKFVYMARGVVTDVTGLFFSFPVWSSGRIVGALVFKYGLDNFFPVNLFKTDVLIIHSSGLVIEGPAKFVGYCVFCDKELLKKALKEHVLGKKKFKGPLKSCSQWIICLDPACSLDNRYIIIKSPISQFTYYVARAVPFRAVLATEFKIFGFWLLSNILVLLITLEIFNWSKVMSTDPLTGLFNRSALFKRIEELVQQAKREKGFVHILMVDLDRFKKINDTYGHHVGDRVLRHVATLLRRYMRPYDVVGRYGGEEFIVAFESLSEEDGIKVAERLRAIIEKSSLDYGGKKIKISASIGVKTLSHSEFYKVRDVSKLVERAVKMSDMALYWAKERGRNRVMAYKGI